MKFSIGEEVGVLGIHEHKRVERPTVNGIIQSEAIWVSSNEAYLFGTEEGIHYLVEVVGYPPSQTGPNGWYKVPVPYLVKLIREKAESQVEQRQKEPVNV